MMSDTFTGWRKATYSHGNGACVEVTTGWRKSTYSHGNENCVKVAAARRVIGVRDAMQRGQGSVLEFGAEAWRAFIGAAKSQHA